MSGKRLKHLDVRACESELDLLHAAAAREGLATSTWLRRLGLERAREVLGADVPRTAVHEGWTSTDQADAE
jgi:hypothetical protein